MSESWANAPEFIPGKRYIPRTADAGSSSKEVSSTNSLYSTVTSKTSVKSESEGATVSGELCPYYFETGECESGPECIYIHGEICKYCDLYCLPPNDVKMRKHHLDICKELKQQEKKYIEAAEMSRNLQCGICYDVVLEKEDKKNRKFGLLSECNHVFCLECIRIWRSSQSNDNSKRTCPLCRKLSYFIVPSEIWVDDPSDKDRLIQSYKEHLATKDCMHFKRGCDHCPFGSNCFYRHALPDGTLVSDNVVKRRVNQDGDFRLMTYPLLADFIEEMINYTQSQIHERTMRSIFQI